MIKANELRPGNWVHIQHRKMVKGMYEPTQVRVVTPQSENSWFPIPLTIELLKQFSFRESTTSPYIDCEAYEIFLDAKKLIWCEGNIYKQHSHGFIQISSFDFITDPQPIRYVHRIQNVIYSLTGIELEIKL